MPDRPFSIVTTPATRTDVRLALLVGIAIFVGFGLSLPFASHQLPKIDSFVPTLQAVIFVTDLATAVLLFGQFVIVASCALLILASGYLWSALMVMTHALSFPGAFAPHGVFGAGIQATPWIYTFWHFGFAAALLAYACMKRRADGQDTIRTSTVRAAWLSVITVVAGACTLTWVLIEYEPYLLPLLRDEINIAPAANYITRVTLATILVAFVLLVVRRSSVLDLWVSVATLAGVLELAIVSFFITSRFSVGFYTLRILSVLASTIVLIALLSETVILYGRLARYIATLQRERTSKLLNVQAAVAALTHQMRQPLTGIGTRASAARRFLSQEQPNPDRAQRILDEIVSATSQTNGAIESIRSLFKDADQPQSPINLNQVILEGLKSLQQEFDEQGIAVSIDLEPSLPLITGHSGQLREVVLNILLNAIEAMQSSKRRKLRVETKQQDQGEVSISVQDSGAGIEQQNMTRIFDAFVTTKDKGTGLGLAVSRMIIELHGGRIFAHSDGGSGARFQITLPIKMASETHWNFILNDAS
jgi:signal transduction histidine kinase